MRLGCLFGHHRRASRSIHDAGTHYAAACKDCGKPLIRNGQGRWISDKSGGEAPVKRSGSSKTSISAMENDRGGPVNGDQGHRSPR